MRRLLWSAPVVGGIDFLFRLFSNEFEIEGLPSRFESVLFEVAEWASPEE